MIEINYQSNITNITKDIKTEDNVIYLDTPTKSGKSMFLKDLYNHINFFNNLKYDMLKYIDDKISNIELLYSMSNRNTIEKDDVDNKIKELLEIANQVKSASSLNELEEISNKIYNNLYNKKSDLTSKRFYELYTKNKFRVEMFNFADNCYLFCKENNFSPLNISDNYLKDKLIIDAINNNYILNIFFEERVNIIKDFYEQNNIGILKYPKNIMEKYKIKFNKYEALLEDCTYEEKVLAFLYELARQDKLFHTLICIDDFSNKSDYVKELLELYTDTFYCSFIVAG